MASSFIDSLRVGLTSLTPFQRVGVGLAALVVFNRLVRPPAQPEDAQKDKEKDEAPMATDYEPSIPDVLVVKAMLGKGLHLPPELIDSIVDQAEYWPHTSAMVDYTVETGSMHVIRGRSQGFPGSENELLLRSVPLGFPRWPKAGTAAPDANIQRAESAPVLPGTPFPPDVFQDLIGSPIPTVTHPCRRIVFTIRSQDQGWGGDYEHQGTYHGSWTWFEAGLQRWCLKEPETTTPATEPQAETAADAETTPTTQDPLEASPENTPNHTPPKPSFTLRDLATITPPVVHPSATPALGDPALLEFQHGLLPDDRFRIQSNKTAARELLEHQVIWSHTDNTPATDEVAVEKLTRAGRGGGTADGSFVRDLRLGDVVTVWGMARFPGWVNYVDMIKMDVYWAV